MQLRITDALPTLRRHTPAVRRQPPDGIQSNRTIKFSFDLRTQRLPSYKQSSFANTGRTPVAATGVAPYTQAPTQREGATHEDGAIPG